MALGLLAVALILGGTGFLYENISAARDRRFNAMLGRRVNIGGGDRPPCLCTSTAPARGPRPSSWIPVSEIRSFPGEKCNPRSRNSRAYVLTTAPGSAIAIPVHAPARAR